MEATILLEWDYSPVDYFEYPLELKSTDYTILLANGKVVASINNDIFESNPKLKNKLDQRVRGALLGAQLCTHKSFSLTKPQKSRIHPDGRRDLFIESETAHLRLTAYPTEIRMIDSDGKVISDTRLERIDKHATLSREISAQYGNDPVLSQIVDSYFAAVEDPKNELVHLYEIREALSTRFGGESGARSKLKIVKADWGLLGRYANDPTLDQSRHRGQSGGPRQKADIGQLEDARRIARSLIEAYLAYLK